MSKSGAYYMDELQKAHATIDRLTTALEKLVNEPFDQKPQVQRIIEWQEAKDALESVKEAA